jgi:excisionase family DNA binding protein
MATEKEFMTLDEAAEYIGVSRATVYNYMNDLKITTRRFGRDKRAYLALADVKTMKDYRENPWKYPRSEEDGGGKPERPAA